MNALVSAAMRGCLDEKWDSFATVRSTIVSLFGFEEYICNTIIQADCTRRPDHLLLWSKTHQHRFVVSWTLDENMHNIFTVQYHGELLPRANVGEGVNLAEQT